ncbi:hypothetical protein LPJ73_006232, partial [Coemansia sp. RSA 2703]
MSDEPKRFSLSDYQSQRAAIKPAETLAPHTVQKSELEELHMLLGTGLAPTITAPAVLRTPGASPDNGDGQQPSAVERKPRKQRDSRDAREHRARSRSPRRRARSRSRSPRRRERSESPGRISMR